MDERRTVLVAAARPLAAVLERELAGARVRVLVTTTAGELAGRLRAWVPDLLVLDADLAARPGEQGSTAAARVTAVLRHLPPGEVRAALLCDRADVAAARAAHAWGVQAFLDKPFGKGQLALLAAALQAPPNERGLALDLVRLGLGVDAVGAPLPSALEGEGPLLVIGEDGTGRHLAARAAHLLGPRPGGAFVEVACARLAAPLLRAELFGSGPGRPGALERAAGGTLYLADIDHVPQDLCPLLAAGLLERGASCALIASRGPARGGGPAVLAPFDAPARTIALSPLRTRAADVPALAWHLLKRRALELGLPCGGVDPAALSALSAYAWPGNVRELATVLDRALELAGGGPISAEHFALPGATERLEVPDLRLETAERLLVERALAAARGRKTQAAKLLGINRATLYNKLRAYGLEDRIQQRGSALSPR